MFQNSTDKLEELKDTPPFQMNLRMCIQKQINQIESAIQANHATMPSSSPTMTNKKIERNSLFSPIRLAPR